MLRFNATVAGEAFACGKSYDGIGTTQSRITPADLRFYVSDVALIDSQNRAVPVELRQDDKWQYRNVALLDFEDGTGACRNGTPGVNEEVVGTVPTARYSGVRFTFGVPFELNLIDPTTVGRLHGQRHRCSRSPVSTCGGRSAACASTCISAR